VIRTYIESNHHKYQKIIMTSDNQQATLDVFDVGDNTEAGPSSKKPDECSNGNSPRLTMDDEEPDSQNNNLDSDANEFHTGDSIANNFLETISGAEIQESSARRYESCLKRYIRDLEGFGKTLLDAQSIDVKKHFRKMARDNLSKKTLQLAHSSILRLYKFIHIETSKEADIDLFILDEIDVNNYQARDVVEKEPLTKCELEKLFEAMNSKRDRLIALVGSETGARNESIRNIKLSDVDLEDNKMSILNTKSGGSYPIPISQEVALKLERWIAVERDARLSGNNSEYLFPSEEGGKLETGDSLRDIIKSAAEEAGIQEVAYEREATEAEKQRGWKKRREYRVTPHILRHTFSHLLDTAGLDSKARSKALDHADVEITEEVYTHAEADYMDLIRELFHGE
jgi:integrase/recombinase XerD